MQQQEDSSGELYEGYTEEMAQERREYEQQEEADNYAKRHVHRCDQDQDFLDLFQNGDRNNTQPEPVRRTVQGTRQRQTNVTIMKTAAAIERESSRKECLDATGKRSTKQMMNVCNNNKTT